MPGRVLRDGRWSGRALAFAILLAALQLGCARPSPTAAGLRASPEVLIDPEFQSQDQATFLQDFVDGPASIRLGPSWHDLEPPWPGTGYRGMAWSHAMSRIYFGVPLASAVDLLAEIMPLVNPSGPQTLTVVLNGHDLPPVAVPASWSAVRIPLQARWLVRPINIADLRFTYESVPVKLGISDDTRSLAVACQRLAVVPHGGSLPAPHPPLPPGTLSAQPMAIPLPPARELDVKIGAIQGAPGTNDLKVELEASDGSITAVWQGPAASARGRELRVESDERPARLLFRLTGAAAAYASLRMDPPTVSAAAPAQPDPGPPNIFLYLIDTLRADELGVYGSKVKTSPRIDAFSHDAVVFDHAESVASWTLPATFSVLSGLYPYHHGVIVPGDRLAEGLMPWLPALLHNKGYETVAVSQWQLGGDNFGMQRGFDGFYQDIAERAKRRSDSARWFLWSSLMRRRRPDQPFFAYVHVVDPHALYRPRGEDLEFAEQAAGKLPIEQYDPNYFMIHHRSRQPTEVAHLRALYDGEVHAADRAFGRFTDLLKFLGLYDNSIIVLLSDHGEEFGEHYGFDHGRTLYEELLHVPLLVKLPHSRGAGLHVPTLVSSIDVAPTLATLSGVTLEGSFDGVPLPLTATSPGSPRVLRSQTRVEEVDLRVARLGNLKCIENIGRVDRFLRPAPVLEVFDLGSDPDEHAPLTAGQDAVRCKALLGPVPRTQERNLPISEDEKARLRALGYLH